MKENYKRINILIEPEQHSQVLEAGLSLSGLIRDLLHDRFSGTTITLSVSKRCKKLYDEVVSNYGVSDQELDSARRLGDRLARLAKKLRREP